MTTINLPEQYLVHLVFFKLKDGLSDETLTAIRDNILNLKSQIPDVYHLDFGKNTTQRGKGFNYALTSMMKDQAALEVYQKHEAHVKVVNEFLKPNMDDVICIDYDFPSKL